ncbi:hypothetical protein MAM1_0007d00817 [Mucor ambiguus]|uniref:Secreted protein n=1 Tax=Mucor ambiguus TaxID=91626 RepID=A0A0C9M4W2_9FUNG|nr:hypothetical protein MAM1_0007d00817 [Mucor ambiguus]
MRSYFLLTLALPLMALFTNQQVSAAAIQEQEACIKRAYAFYDAITKHGCNVNEAEGKCKERFDFGVRTLNDLLDRCQRSDYVTLCRIIPSGGFFSFTRCTSLQENGKLTKAECQAKAREDYVFHGEDGSRSVFKAGDSRCINTINYNCHNLC